MSIVSHLLHLFNAETCQSYIHTLRWKDRPLQCPRCQSLNVGPWGTYHAQPGLKRYRCKEKGCQRTFHDLTGPLLDGSKHSLMHWILATFLLCLSCSSRRIARELASMSVRVIAGAGGCAMRLSLMRSDGSWQGRSKPMISTIRRGRRDRPRKAGRRRWAASHEGVARNASRAGATMIKIGRRSSPG
jgi:transposase-like protein